MNLNNGKAECCRSSGEHSERHYHNNSLPLQHSGNYLCSKKLKWERGASGVGLSDETPRNFNISKSVFLRPFCGLLAITINMIIPSLFLISFTLHLLYKWRFHLFVPVSCTTLTPGGPPWSSCHTKGKTFTNRLQWYCVAFFFFFLTSRDFWHRQSRSATF